MNVKKLFDLSGKTALITGGLADWDCRLPRPPRIR